MRAILFILIIAVLVVIAGIATGFLNINQIRSAKAPQISTTGNGSVKVGTKQATVKVPALVVEKPGQNQAAATTNNAM